MAEGASPKAAGIATPDGHSVDGTLEALHRFKADEDTENKLTIVTAENHDYPNGFWPGEKDEQSQAYAERATGEYLWQIDIDEFYKPGDLMAIVKLLKSAPSITQVNMPWLNFWGGFDYLVDGLFLQRHYRSLGGGVPRIFKWGPGYRYVKHRPPTVVDDNGADLRSRKLVSGNLLARKGIYCYHYASIFPGPLSQKMRYYSRQDWLGSDRFEQWYESNFVQIRQPFRVHHVVQWISWLKPFEGTHPPQIQQLIHNLKDGSTASLRRTDDIERLLASRRYQLGTRCFQVLTPLLLETRRRLPNRAKLVECFIENAFSPGMAAGAPNE